MSKIVFIAPDKDMYETGKKVIKEMQSGQKIEEYVGVLNSGVALAKELEKEGADVIVSRGGTAELIVKAGIRIPVVGISVTCEDLAYAINNIRRITGIIRPRIALFVFKNMVLYNMDELAMAFNVEFLIHYLNCEEDIPHILDKVMSEKVDAVLGGVIETELAKSKGLKAFLLKSSESSLMKAFLEAERILYGMEIEREKTEELRALIDYSIEGIISADTNRRVVIFNNYAQKLLGYKKEDVIDKDIEKLIPAFKVTECLNTGKEYIGEMMKVGGVNILANIVPIKVNGEINKVMVTFQEVERIRDMEAKIRKELYTKGLVSYYNFDDILGISDNLNRIKEVAKDYARVDTTVLITGETGTGKELFAQSIHSSSLRKNGPFVAVNCAAIPSNLLESELFGYVEGAFTGANKRGKMGLFELAHGGTIFLDEISEMDLNAQARLLRVIQEKRIMRLGDERFIPIDTRIIAATNKDLLRLVKEGKFREDLYYRLNILTLRIPPLRDRREDIQYLAIQFINNYNKIYGKDIEISKDALSILSQYEWPGNVRELKNTIEKIVVITNTKTVTAKEVNELFNNSENEYIDVSVCKENGSERDIIIKALKDSDFNKKKCAAMLGMTRSTLYRKLKFYDIEIKKICDI